MTDRRLRIQHIVIQPVLAWDNGEELEPGPELKPITLPLSKLQDFAERFPQEVADMAAQIAVQEAESSIDT